MLNFTSKIFYSSFDYKFNLIFNFLRFFTFVFNVINLNFFQIFKQKLLIIKIS